MKLVNKLNEKKEKITEHFRKLNKNIRWEQRYNNLEKKYEALKAENESLKKAIDYDYNCCKVREYKTIIKRKNAIIENLQDDNKRLMGGKNDNTI